MIRPLRFCRLTSACYGKDIDEDRSHICGYCIGLGVTAIVLSAVVDYALWLFVGSFGPTNTSAVAQWPPFGTILGVAVAISLVATLGCYLAMHHVHFQSRDDSHA